MDIYENEALFEAVAETLRRYDRYGHITGCVAPNRIEAVLLVQSCPDFSYLSGWDFAALCAALGIECTDDTTAEDLLDATYAYVDEATAYAEQILAKASEEEAKCAEEEAKERKEWEQTVGQAFRELRAEMGIIPEEG